VVQDGTDISGIDGTCRVLATITNPYGIRNIEDGGHVYLCTGLREPLGQLWPRLRHYD
jgi:hypothetical protein